MIEQVHVLKCDEPGGCSEFRVSRTAGFDYRSNDEFLKGWQVVGGDTSAEDRHYCPRHRRDRDG